MAVENLFANYLIRQLNTSFNITGCKEISNPVSGTSFTVFDLNNYA